MPSCFGTSIGHRKREKKNGARTLFMTVVMGVVVNLLVIFDMIVSDGEEERKLYLVNKSSALCEIVVETV